VSRLPIAVLVSGRGSNLEAILEAPERDGFPARVAVVVSDRERAPALDRARRHGVPAVFLNPKDYAGRTAYDAALLALLEAHRVELACLAGFMRILTPGFVRALAGRILNVHPSLLPAFPGLAAQRQALDHGVKVTGATVHFVDEGVDTGPIIFQAAVPVLDDGAKHEVSHENQKEHRRPGQACIPAPPDPPGRLAPNGTRKEGDRGEDDADLGRGVRQTIPSAGSPHKVGDAGHEHDGEGQIGCQDARHV
jgi:phosphoribosylglycinamide formyltransferase-1